MNFTKIIKIQITLKIKEKHFLKHIFLKLMSPTKNIVYNLGRSIKYKKKMCLTVCEFFIP